MFLGLPKFVKRHQLKDYFSKFCLERRTPNVILPKRGRFGFVYFSALEDYRASLARDEYGFMGYTLCVTPGTFHGSQCDNASAVGAA